MKYIYKLIFIFTLIKVMYVVQSVYTPFPDYNRMKFEWTENYFLHIFSNNDSGHYENIAENGYPLKTNIYSREACVYAFFPAYPFITSIIKNLFQISTLLAIFITTNLLSYLMLISFFLLVKEITKDENISFLSALVLIVFPHHYYFSMYYTESLFLLLLVLSFYSLKTEKAFFFMVASSILVLTRINGIFTIIPLLLFYNHNRFHIDKSKKYYIFLPMILVFISYLIFLKINTGNYFAFKIAAENNWGGHIQNPAPGYIKSFSMEGSNSFLKYNAIYSLFFIIVSYIFIAKKEYSFFLLCIITIVVPLLEGSATSQPRFISILFPFSILIGTILSKVRFPYAIISILLILQLITFAFWNTTHPLSY